jgi:TonB family protein
MAEPRALDPNHPPRLGPEYYPSDSVRLREEGTCWVKITVAADGAIHDIVLARSTGYPRLDDACLSAFADGRLIPATVDGTPVERAVVIPITWQLPPLKPGPKVDPSTSAKLITRQSPNGGVNKASAKCV